MDRRNCLIVGASARAAAWSALRAGFRPCAADRFADVDLMAVAECVPLGSIDDPERLAAVVPLSTDPWMYTGGLENRPDLIEAIASRRPLWGNRAAVVRAVRDPSRLSRTLQAEGFSAPEARLDSGDLPCDGSWLRKPLASVAGLEIGRFPPDNVPGILGPVYYQRRIAGLSLSAIFLGTRHGARLAGITLQRIGYPGVPYGYRGNVAPWSVTPATADRIAAIGAVLAGQFGLIGLFGVDLIVDEVGEPWPVEVNPRYTAAVEVIELATGRALLADHQRACEGQSIEGPWPLRARRVVAREVIFADARLVFDEAIAIPRDDPFRLPDAADLPARGTRFEPGEPVLTVFGAGATAREAIEALSGQIEKRRRRFRREVEPDDSTQGSEKKICPQMTPMTAEETRKNPKM